MTVVLNQRSYKERMVEFFVKFVAKELIELAIDSVIVNMLQDVPSVKKIVLEFLGVVGNGYF